MYSSILGIVLIGSGLGAEGLSPVWNRDYASVRRQARQEDKPVAVFFGTGADGRAAVCRGGAFSHEVQQLLVESYICLYVDFATLEGQRLARAFDFEDAPALVISTAKGNEQAFRLAGEIADEDLARYLRRYADPERQPRVTETAGSAPDQEESIETPQGVPPEVLLVPFMGRRC